MGSAHAPPYFHTGMRSFFGLAGEVVVNASGGEVHHALRQDLQHLVVALEGRCAAVLRPVRSETDLQNKEPKLQLRVKLPIPRLVGQVGSPLPTRYLGPPRSPITA